MADLRIVDAPLLSTVKGTEKIPTGGEGNFSVSVNQVADFAKLKWILATEGYVDNAIGNVQADLNLHKNNESNPHNVTKAQVGLGNVDNTADLDKPVSNATQSAITTANSGKADKSYVDSQDQLKADKTYVDSALSNFTNGTSKFYPTLVAANADIANITTKDKVEVGEIVNGGTWYKATIEATSLTKSPYDPLIQSKEFTLSEIIKYLELFNTRSGWSIAFKDSIDQILFGTDLDGKFWAQGVAVVDDLIKSIARISKLENLIFATSDPVRTGVIFSIQDESGQMLIHLSSDFTLFVGGVSVGVSQEIIDEIASLTNSLTNINTALNPLNTFTAIGDSLTEGAGSTNGQTYPYYLSQATSRNTSNQGIGGQDSLQISTRLNGATLLATFADNLIPAETTAKSVTLNTPLLTTPATTAARTRKVWINGVYGTLEKDTLNKYTFARDSSGSAVNVAPNSPVIIDVGDLQNRICLIWMGTNNSFSTEADRQLVIDNIDAVIKSLKPINKKYLVLSPWKPTTNIKGSDTHNQMLEMHKLLASKYKDRFVNVWYDLVCSYDPNIPQDVIDFNNMVIPSSKMSDGVHPNSAGYQVVGYQSIPQKLNELGW